MLFDCNFKIISSSRPINNIALGIVGLMSMSTYLWVYEGLLNHCYKKIRFHCIMQCCNSEWERFASSIYILGIKLTIKMHKDDVIALINGAIPALLHWYRPTAFFQTTIELLKGRLSLMERYDERAELMFMLLVSP